MNVLDHLKTKTVPEIKEYYINNTIPAASAMMHVTGDFNLSTLIRNSNFFGYEKVFYVGGKKHYDRRGTVGTHNYIDITFIKTEEEFVKTIKDQGYTLISIENNVNYECTDLFQFMDNVNVKDIKPIFIFGEEQKGLSDYILDNSEHILTISGKGTVRSLNVGTASGIVLGYYSKFF
jgi:tRNA G18 (ribose-2'-O)-methylase SpoU